MKLKLYNSLSAKKEVFEPYDQNNVQIYVCGPTVYANPHLGNARSAVEYDLIYRVLKELYPKVTYVRNITNVDDKINAAALERKISIDELTKEVLEEFHSDMNALCNLEPDIEPKVTDHMEDIIAMIGHLIDNGHAYESGGHVYFSVKSYDNYGKLSGRDIDDLIQGARVEVSEHKRDAEDFVLWKPAKATDDKSSIFKSPWSAGRPGWHIECSVMSTKFLGENFDIHGGGADLKFPHHENEIAQSCCANKGSSYAKYWVHNGFLTVNGEKMSKSLGNFITVRELLRGGVEARALRLILLSTHYRKPLDYNFKALEDARRNISRFDVILDATENMDLSNEKLAPEFLEPLLDDINIAKSLAYLFDLVKEVNSNSTPENLRKCAKIIGFLGFAENRVKQEMPVEILTKAKAIQNARMAKNYEEADRLRDELIASGYHISYSKTGEIEVKAK